MMLAELLASRTVGQAELSHHVNLMASTPVKVGIELMNRERTMCALVTDGDRLCGIFTDRDVLTRVAGNPAAWERPVREVMTEGPETVRADQPVIDALRVMTRYRIRNLPALDANGGVVGNLTHFSLLQLIDGLLQEAVAEHDDGLATRHSLAFVDFRGVAVARPVCLTVGTTVAHAVRQMQARGIGSVIVVDKRGSLAGVFTETDVQRRVVGKVDDLAGARIEDFMTADPLRLTPRDPISAAFRLMAEHRFSHLPLVGATRKPVGIVSFRDLADYLETALSAAA